MIIPADALVIGLGGNVGGDDAITDRFRRAREAFTQLGDVKSAPLYRTGAIGPAQPAFLNTAVRVRLPDAIAAEVIANVLEIEMLLGRDRRAEARWGPRTIDLDVLVWGIRELRTPELEVPHPRLVGRRFALRPLVELFGEDTLLPGTSHTIGELERRVAAQELEQIAATW